MPTSVANRAGQDGFTLLEVLLVLSIIALGSALLVPRLGDIGGRGFQMEVRSAASLLNHARRNAVVTGNPATISFIPELTEPDLDYHPPAFSAGVYRASDLEMHFKDSTGALTPVSAPLEITFFPEGGSTGGTLLLSQGDRSASISIDPVSGRMETAFDDQAPP